MGLCLVRTKHARHARGIEEPPARGAEVQGQALPEETAAEEPVGDFGIGGESDTSKA